jgi:hypothetical protein
MRRKYGGTGGGRRAGARSPIRALDADEARRERIGGPRGCPGAKIVAMARVEGLEPADADDRSRAVLEAQARQYGAPLNPYPIFARRPSILRAVRGGWSGIDESGLLDGALRALLNRRVASLNGCEF